MQKDLNGMEAAPPTKLGKEWDIGDGKQRLMEV